MSSASPTSAVLVVDDDADIREAIGMALAELDLVVLEAENGSQALQALRAAPRLPCLVLLDLMMPVMNGWEFVQEQRSDPRLASLPVVLMTAMPDARTRSPEVAARLSKPIAYEELLTTVRRFVTAG